MPNASPTASPTPRASRRSVPAAVSLLALLALTVGVAAWALHHERAAPAPPARALAGRPTLLVDVLTGRRTLTDGTPEPPTSGWGSPGQPLRLRFVPSSDLSQANVTIENLLAFLRRRTGYAIRGAILRSYGLVVQEIVQGQCEVAFLTAASYARARYATLNNDDPDDGIEAFLSAVRRGRPEHPGSDLAYRAAILVRADSDLHDVAQLDGRSVAMGSRTSGAGSILPTALFNELGIEPRISRYEGYPVIVTAVLQGSADAGCIWWSPPNAEAPENDARLLVRETNPDVFKRTRIIGFTAWIPNEPVVIRQAVPLDVRHTLARAIALYVATLAVTEAGRRELASVGGVIGFLPATNDDFLPLMETIERAFANDPEGRRDFMAGSK